MSPANYLLRAVVMAAGQHEIRSSYRPRSFLFGVLLSTASAAVVLFLLCRRQS